MVVVGKGENVLERIYKTKAKTVASVERFTSTLAVFAAALAFPAAVSIVSGSSPSYKRDCNVANECFGGRREKEKWQRNGSTWNVDVPG
jgi:hypothetical protein